MGHPFEELAELVERFVPVRVTDMGGFDLDTFAFDFDLTIALLTARADGTVYHRFGGRDHRGADRFLTDTGLMWALRATLERHADAPPVVLAEAPAPRRAIEDFPSFGPWLAARDGAPDCLHCHQVGEHEVRSASMTERGFDRESIWRWPSPLQVGLDLDPDDQGRIIEVVPGSPAEAAGLMSGDRLLGLRGVPVATFADVQFGLHGADGGATGIDVTYTRYGPRVGTVLRLPDGWKRGDASTFAWRPLKWGLSPAPGFGGQDIGAEAKGRLGLDPAAHAFSIGYFVTWGEFAHRGRAAQEHLRKGDVVWSVDGKADFLDQDHFHAWFRLHMEAGRTVPVGVVRGGEHIEVPLVVQR